MRDIIAALLRSRGYTHNDGADPDDLNWFSPELGFRPLLTCVAHEMNRDLRGPTLGWNTYEVSVASRRAVHDQRFPRIAADG